MIKLHRLNGDELMINAELIETVEAVPDTVINLYTNNRFIVKEKMNEVFEKIIEYKTKTSRPNLPQVDFGRK